MKSLLFLTR